MKKIFSSLLALLILLPASGAEASMFDTFMDDAKTRGPMGYPSNQISDFVIDEMLRWEDSGIKLTRDDVKSAVDGKLWTAGGDGLCQNKVDASGEKILFVMGASDAGCTGVRDGILSLVDAEEQADRLGDDLLMATNGSELAIADEPHRPIRMGTLSLILKHVWSGTGAGLLPWDKAADTQFDALDGKLKALSSEDLDKVILRFHHGYFRDGRELDPRFSGVGDDIGSSLADIAATLKILGDPQATGEFVTPSFKQVGNVALWARKDDLGLMWIYPSHFTRLEIEQADDYPTLAKGSIAKVLAYPFSYQGSASSASKGVRSPLCSRTVGKQGYLCRKASVSAAQCANGSSSSSSSSSSGSGSRVISLVECSVDTTETDAGPDVCKDLNNLYADDGTPLTPPGNPGQINSSLKPADTDTLCSPETKILYPDDISAHACYIGHCLAQSMHGHTLVPNRNTTLIDENTSPYLSCVRADPRLGLYAETAHKSPFVLPRYVGHLLVQDFEREYCIKNGDAARGVLSDCAFHDDTIAQSPSDEQMTAVNTIVRNAAEIAKSQDDFLSIALPLGQRVALDQAIPVNQKLFAAMAQFVRQMGDLLQDLKRAPVTITPCPWTGPFKEFGP